MVFKMVTCGPTALNPSLLKDRSSHNQQRFNSVCVVFIMLIHRCHLLQSLPKKTMLKAIKADDKKCTSSDYIYANYNHELHQRVSVHFKYQTPPPPQPRPTLSPKCYIYMTQPGLSQPSPVGLGVTVMGLFLWVTIFPFR